MNPIIHSEGYDAGVRSALALPKPERDAITAHDFSPSAWLDSLADDDLLESSPHGDDPKSDSWNDGFWDGLQDCAADPVHYLALSIPAPEDTGEIPGCHFGTPASLWVPVATLLVLAMQGGGDTGDPEVLFSAAVRQLMGEKEDVWYSLVNATGLPVTTDEMCEWLEVQLWTCGRCEANNAAPVPHDSYCANCRDPYTDGLVRLSEGEFVSGWWGQFTTATALLICYAAGFYPRERDEMVALAQRKVDGMGAAPEGYVELTPDEEETLQWELDDAAAWATEHLVPDGFYVGSHPDVGGWGVWDGRDDDERALAAIEAGEEFFIGEDHGRYRVLDADECDMKGLDIHDGPHYEGVTA